LPVVVEAAALLAVEVVLEVTVLTSLERIPAVGRTQKMLF
jgi:hypothetical protein